MNQKNYKNFEKEKIQKLQQRVDELEASTITGVTKKEGNIVQRST